MRQGEGFGKVLIQTEAGGERTRDLRYLKRVGEAVPKVIGNGGREHLGLIFEAAEGPGMHDAVTIPLKVVPVRMRDFRITPAAAGGDGQAQSRESFRFGQAWHVPLLLYRDLAQQRDRVAAHLVEPMDP